ncbi:hypothetical protein LMG26842_05811 [Achromobacter dolens]|uniref:hypothetical protein n=1 Tax=Achromobacter dolens TaxID=1287738 RepID=UPI0014659C03|nr:hypothetical protein [Achromobacter dolens]CAB3909854.1 hypothetical protein LMG26842_05811 [Achromobacter dolens]
MTNRAEFERLLDVYGFRCERFGQDLSTHARAQVVSAFAALASAPVAEDDEVQRIKDRGPAYPYTPNTAPPTPLASAPVAGEAVSVDVYVYRQDNRYLATALLPIDTPLRPGLNTLYAAPQASAEDDWKAAIRKFMDTAIPALAAIANVHTPDEIDALDAMPREPVIDQVRRLSQACEELSQQVRPERHKADKDGGQQRTAFDHPVFAFLLGEGQLHGVDFGERAPGAVGKWWWRKDLRAAISAPQAEQGERDE